MVGEEKGEEGGEGAGVYALRGMHRCKDRCIEPTELPTCSVLSGEYSARWEQAAYSCLGRSTAVHAMLVVCKRKRKHWFDRREMREAIEESARNGSLMFSE